MKIHLNFMFSVCSLLKTMEYNKIVIKLVFFEFICGLVIFYLIVYKPIAFVMNYLSNYWFSTASKIFNPGKNFYAVITGATDGIGLEYARQLAKKGYNLVLISRTEEKLIRVAREIQEQYPQSKKIEYLEVDFSRTDIYDRIKYKLESLSGSIHVLVNNVGMANSFLEYFTKHSDGFHLKLINTNIVSMTVMSEIVLRIMLSQNYDAKVNPARGVLINISSGLGLSEIPMLSSYGASKAYVKYLSNCLSTEYERLGIIVQTVTPNMVKTNMITNIDEGSFLINHAVKAEAMVRHALKAVGTEQQTSGHPRHKILNWFIQWAEQLFGHKMYMKGKFVLMRLIKNRHDSITNSFTET